MSTTIERFTNLRGKVGKKLAVAGGRVSECSKNIGKKLHLVWLFLCLIPIYLGILLTFAGICGAKGWDEAQDWASWTRFYLDKGGSAGKKDA